MGAGTADIQPRAHIFLHLRILLVLNTLLAVLAQERLLEVDPDAVLSRDGQALTLRNYIHRRKFVP